MRVIMNVAHIMPEPDDNEIEWASTAAAPLSIETELDFATRRGEHITWQYQVARAIRWAQWWSK